MRARLQQLFAFVLFALLLVAAFFVVRTAVRTFQSLQKEVAAALVTGLAAVVVALVSTFVGRRLERRHALEVAQQQRRIPVYEEFVQGLLQTMGATVPPSKRKPMTEEQVVTVMGAFTEKVLVWGSEEVIRAWGRWKKLAATEDPVQQRLGLDALEDFFLALRKDLGLSNKNLQRGDVLRLWINDWDQFAT